MFETLCREFSLSTKVTIGAYRGHCPKRKSVEAVSDGTRHSGWWCESPRRRLLRLDVSGGTFLGMCYYRCEAPIRVKGLKIGVGRDSQIELGR